MIAHQIGVAVWELGTLAAAIWAAALIANHVKRKVDAVGMTKGEYTLFLYLQYIVPAIIFIGGCFIGGWYIA